MEARRVCVHAPEAFQHESGADEEDQRGGQFAGHQHTAEPHSQSAGGGFAAFFELAMKVGPGK